MLTGMRTTKLAVLFGALVLSIVAVFGGCASSKSGDTGGSSSVSSSAASTTGSSTSGSSGTGGSTGAGGGDAGAGEGGW
jgi:hypothetical protein